MSDRIKINGYTYRPLSKEDIGTKSVRGDVYLNGESSYCSFPIERWNTDGSETQMYRYVGLEENTTLTEGER